MPDPRDGKFGKMPHYCPGGGGGWALLELTDALTLFVDSGECTGVPGQDVGTFGQVCCVG